MTARARTRQHRRRALAALMVTGAFFGSVTFFLADTGVSTMTISPPAGVSADGKIASLTPLSVSFTRPQGNAQIQAGLAIERITVAKGRANTLKVDMAWVNPMQSAQVLNNPNAQIHVGLYYPIHTGTCTSGHANSTSDTRATITDNLGAGAVTLCTALDTAATGSLTSAGKMILSKTNVAGFLRMAATDPAGAVPCPGAGTSWCRPANVNADNNVFYIGVTIVTPGGKPAGQQNNVSTLDFYSSLTGV
jgi:hypothetical protein